MEDIQDKEIEFFPTRGKGRGRPKTRGRGRGKGGVISDVGKADDSDLQAPEQWGGPKKDPPNKPYLAGKIGILLTTTYHLCLSMHEQKISII